MSGTVLSLAAASTFFGMKASIEGGKSALRLAALRVRDFEDQINLAKVRSLENQVVIRERREVAMNELINTGNFDLGSGTGRALSNRIESVTDSDLTSNALNTTFQVSSLNISKQSAHQTGKSAMKQAKFRALGSFFNFASGAVGGFSQGSKPSTLKSNSFENRSGFGNSRGGEFGS